MKLNSGAFRFIFVCILFFGSDVLEATAQNAAPPPTNTRALPAPPDAETLKRHDLKWIKTGNDFDQSKYATADEIDKEIEKRVAAYNRVITIGAFDVPINSRRLSYRKYQKYVDFQKEIANLDLAKNEGGALNKNAHFWRYGDIDIAVPEDTHIDQMNVYAIARAVEILKYRYPEAYQKLFVELRNFQTETLSYARFRNRYAVLLFSFDESPDAIAGGLTAIGEEKNGQDNVKEFSNVSVVSIHNINIQGVRQAGSRPIYMSSVAEENYVRYLREGLVETLVHEMLHRYIDYMNTYKEVFNKLYQARYDSAYPLNMRLAGEEAIAITTSLHYFRSRGGLENDLYLYYGVVLGTSINKLENALLADKYARIVDPAAVHLLPKDRLRLDILD